MALLSQTSPSVIDLPYESSCFDQFQKSVYCPFNEEIPTGLTRKTIGNVGCFLISALMLSAYHGVDQNTLPVNLNDWLSINNSQLKFVENTRASLFPEKIRQALCDRRAQQAEVANYPNHFVVLYGKETEPLGWLVYDPANAGEDTKLSKAWPASSGSIPGYKNPTEPESLRIYKSTYIDTPDLPTPSSEYGFLLIAYSPVHFVVIGPNGKKTGMDPITDTRFQEIPEAGYEIGPTGQGMLYESFEDVPEHTEKSFHARSPINGEYIVKVVGTHTGTYKLVYLPVNRTESEEFFDAASIIADDVVISPNEEHVYRLQVNTNTLTTVPVVSSGGFLGGGQRAKDVNRFLRYSASGQTVTELPIGTNKYSLMISYDDSFIEGTLTATLNGQTITNLFTQVAGSNEKIELPLQAGRNIVKLTGDGLTDSNRVATDSDRLVFKVLQ